MKIYQVLRAGITNIAIQFAAIATVKSCNISLNLETVPISSQSLIFPTPFIS